MTRWSWKHGGYCITGILGEIDVPHESFATSCVKGMSPLWWRIPILLWALVVLFWSMAFFWGPTGKFFLYMTHWGLLFVVVETIFGIIATIKNPRGVQTDATFGLPWYVKTYWVLYNITIPVAFLITVFYWGVLKASTRNVMINYAPDPVLDVMVHGVNSIVMFMELVFSAHPSRLLHIMQPLYFAGAYMLFTVIYYFAGGVDPWGNPFVYPVVDWSKPNQTMVVITLTALFLALMHLITVAVATTRDAIVRKRLNEPSGLYNDGFRA